MSKFRVDRLEVVENGNNVSWNDVLDTPGLYKTSGYGFHLLNDGTDLYAIYKSDIALGTEIPSAYILKLQATRVENTTYSNPHAFKHVGRITNWTILIDGPASIENMDFTVATQYGL